MSLKDLRTSVVSTLGTALGTGTPIATLFGRPVNVSDHEGEFDEDTLHRCARTAPAAIVALDRVSKVEVIGNSTFARVNVIVSCITKNRAGQARDESALILVGEVLRVVRESDFTAGAACLKRAESLVARNWYSEKLAKSGCTLWAVVFQVLVEILPLSETLDDLLSLYADWDLAPRDDGADLGDELEAQDTIPLDGDP